MARAVVLALAVAGCGGGDSRPAATTVPTSAPPTTAAGSTTTAARGGAAFFDEVLEGSDQAGGYTYRQSFPRLAGLADTAVQDRVNEAIRAVATAIIDGFVAEAEDAARRLGPSSPGSSLTGGYTVARLGGGLASVELGRTVYVAGAAHPFGTGEGLTFDLRTGARLALADLFAPGAEYLGALSEQSRRSLRAQFGPDAFPGNIDAGTQPAAESFAVWTVTDQELVLTFPQGQAAPSAVGTTEVRIPLASLRDLLNPTRPLAPGG